MAPRRRRRGARGPRPRGRRGRDPARARGGSLEDQRPFNTRARGAPRSWRRGAGGGGVGHEGMSRSPILPPTPAAPTPSAPRRSRCRTAERSRSTARRCSATRRRRRGAPGACGTAPRTARGLAACPRAPAHGSQPGACASTRSRAQSNAKGRGCSRCAASGWPRSRPTSMRIRRSARSAAAMRSRGCPRQRAAPRARCPPGEQIHAAPRRGRARRNVTKA